MRSDCIYSEKKYSGKSNSVEEPENESEQQQRAPLLWATPDTSCVEDERHAAPLSCPREMTWIKNNGGAAI